MRLITLTTMLATAKRHHFAVGAFNAIDNHFVDAIFAAAQTNNSPIILNFAEVHARLVNIEDIAAYVRYKASKTSLPVTLNLDHGLTIPMVERALDSGFSSVMFDGSHLSYEENIRQTAEVVAMCHARHVCVEGELGAVGGDEGGALEGRADVACYTDVSLAQEYVSMTGVDALAVAIGNSHGRYKGKPELDFERLQALSSVVSTPLVLHGGSGLSDEDFRRAIQLGITKINFFTGMSQAALQTIENRLQSPELNHKYDHYLLLMKDVQQAISETVTEQMRIFGSHNKAGCYE